MSFLNPLLLVISTVGYFTFLVTRLNVRLTQAPFIFCCFVSVLVYFFGIIGALKYGAVVVLCLGIALIFLSNYKNIPLLEKKPSKYLITFIFIFPYIAYYLSISNDFKFLLWDEFSFWASSQKLIFETNALYQENSPLFIKSYPPGQQIFQYYFTKFTFWSEKNVLYAQIFWVLSSLLCISGTLTKNLNIAALAFIGTGTFLYFFNYGYVSIYSDQLLGLIFATSIALAYQQDKKQKNVVALSLAIAALLLTKEIAVLLTLITLVLYLIILYFDRDKQQEKWFQQSLSVAIPFAAVAIFALLIHKSWSWYVLSINASRKLDLSALTQFTEPAQSVRFTKTIAEFIHRLFKSDYLAFADINPKIHISIALLVLVLLIVSMLLIVLAKSEQRAKVTSLVSILFLGALAYTGALTFTYFVFFTEYEGTRLASFERYLSTYMLAWAVIIYNLCSATAERLNKKIAISIPLVLLSIALYFVPRNYYADLKKIQPKGQDFETRNKVEQLALKTKKYIKLNEKVYFIAQNTNGLERTMFYYAMLPYPISMEWCWSIGQKYFEGDVWTCNTHLSQILKDYDYLAIYKADEQFWKNNGEMFKREMKGITDGIFRINRKNGAIDSISQLE